MKVNSMRKPIRAAALISCVFLVGILFDRWTAPAMGEGHKAHHGGALNVIGDEIGHVEVRLSDGIVELWFVGGGNDTGRVVPIKAEKVTLTVEKELVLDAAPLVLAGESTGNCSHFSAQADWLNALGEFDAHGHVVFKGNASELTIRYPHGYDPGHGEGERHHHEEHSD